jgi:8-amino-7-oxononanoate synthase
MDGDIANIKKLSIKARKHKSSLLIDEAHSLGVFGPEGRGLVYGSSLCKEKNIFVTGTFGKSIGTFGAFFSGEQDYVEYVMQKSRSYIYSTSLPVNAVEATRKSLKIINKEDWRREKLFSLINYYKKNIYKSGFISFESDSQIQAILIGSSKDAMYISEELLKKSIYIPAIRPPTVKEGSARLRVSLTVDHEEDDIDYLINILHTISINLVQS